MISGSIVGFNSLDIVECNVDGMLYKFTKGDVFELMKVQDRIIGGGLERITSPKGYSFCDITGIRLDKRYGMFPVNQYVNGSLRRYTPSYPTFRISFTLLNTGGILMGSSMDIDDLPSRIRQLRLERLVGEGLEGTGD